jgi:hypothetical protein
MEKIVKLLATLDSEDLDKEWANWELDAETREITDKGDVKA